MQLRRQHRPLRLLPRPPETSRQRLRRRKRHPQQAAISQGPEYRNRPRTRLRRMRLRRARSSLAIAFLSRAEMRAARLKTKPLDFETKPAR